MRSFRLAAFSLMVFAGLMVGSSMAQTSSVPGEIHSGKYMNAAFQMGRGLPYGTYQQSCRDIRMSGDRLQARCQKKDGGWRDTSMDYRSCRGSIINDDGNLRCGGGPSWQMGGGPGGYRRGEMPEGDYRRTCQNVRMNGDRLEARCQKRDGGWRDTSMDYRACGGTVINDDGNLRCGGGGWQGGRMGGGWNRGLPEGDYRQTCQNVRMNGDRLEARCQKRDGGWRDTSMDYRACGGTVINDDGNLRCGGGGRGGRMGGGWYGGLPQGDYQQTCQDVRVNGDRLDARCQKKDGGWRDTSLDYRRCRGTIANDDGNLRCR